MYNEYRNLHTYLDTDPLNQKNENANYKFDLLVTILLTLPLPLPPKFPDPDLKLDANGKCGHKQARSRNNASRCTEDWLQPSVQPGPALLAAGVRYMSVPLSAFSTTLPRL